MKTFSIILILGLALQTTYVKSRFYKKFGKTCLAENGFIDEVLDLERLMAIGDPEQADKLKDVSQEKMAAVFACLHQKIYTEKNLYPKQNLSDDLKSFIQRDDRVSEVERRRMAETLSTCNKTAGGNNTKLLSCVNVMASPFADLMALIRDVGETADSCFSKCSVTLSKHLQFIDALFTVKSEVNDTLTEIISREKYVCLLACDLKETSFYTEKKMDESTFGQHLEKFITQHTSYDENQKKKMLRILNACKQQAPGEDNYPKTDELIQCLSTLAPSGGEETSSRVGQPSPVPLSLSTGFAFSLSSYSIFHVNVSFSNHD